MTYAETEDEFEFGPNEIVLHCFDVTGREVVALYGRWKFHIRGRHAEVNDHYDAVKETIQAPYRILQDKTYPNRLNYYRHGALPPPYRRLFLKVCVEFSRNGLTGIIGQIITAYPTRRVDPKETQQWP